MIPNSGKDGKAVEEIRSQFPLGVLVKYSADRLEMVAEHRLEKARKRQGIVVGYGNRSKNPECVRVHWESTVHGSSDTMHIDFIERIP